MANWTKATLASRVLEYIKVKPVGQGVDASYTALVQDIIDSIHAQLRKSRVGSFSTSSIPDWAKWPMVKIVAGEVAHIFGKRGFENSKYEGKQELAAYSQKEQSAYPARPDFY